MRTLLVCSILFMLLFLHACSTDSNDEIDGEQSKAATLVSDTWPGSASGDTDARASIEDRLYQQVNDGVHGDELCEYDPANGPRLLADVVPDNGGSNPSHMVALDEILYFAANDEHLGRELWAYDPTC